MAPSPIEIFIDPISIKIVSASFHVSRGFSSLYAYKARISTSVSSAIKTNGLSSTAA